MTKALIKSCAAIGLVLSMMQPVFAANSVGHVVWTKGAFSAGGRSLERNSPIFEGDVLVTGAASQAEVAFTDNSLMTFKAGTQFSVDSYHFKKKGGNFTGSLATGGFRTITGLIAKNHPANYAVNTPVATIGVRGTDYQTAYNDGYLYVVAYSGTVCITPTGSPSQSCPLGLCKVIQDMNVPC
jgi:hypothetical protein